MNSLIIALVLTNIFWILFCLHMNYVWKDSFEDMVDELQDQYDEFSEQWDSLFREILREEDEHEELN